MCPLSLCSQTKCTDWYIDFVFHLLFWMRVLTDFKLQMLVVSVRGTKHPFNILPRLPILPKWGSNRCESFGLNECIIVLFLSLAVALQKGSCGNRGMPSFDTGSSCSATKSSLTVSLVSDLCTTYDCPRVVPALSLQASKIPLWIKYHECYSSSCAMVVCCW